MTTRERTALEVEVSRALESVERVVSMLDEDPAKAFSSSSSACLLESLVSKCDRLRENHRLVLQQQQQAPEEDPIIPVTEDEENTTIAALLLDDDDDDDDSVVATSRNLVTPLPPKRCCKRASHLFSEDDFAVQIKKMCALEDHFATQRTKRRRRRDDDPKPKCRRLPSEDSATEEEEDEEDDDDEPDQPEESSSQTPPVVTETTQSEEQTSGGGRQVADAALGKLGLLPPEVTLALLSQLNGSDLGRLECCCRTTRGSQGIVEFAVLHVKRHQYGVTQMPLLKRETYPHLVCRWEWTRTSKSFSTRTDEVAAALQSLDFLNRHPTTTPLPAVVVPPAAPTEHPTTTTQAAVLADNSTV